MKEREYNQICNMLKEARSYETVEDQSLVSLQSVKFIMANFVDDFDIKDGTVETPEEE